MVSFRKMNAEEISAFAAYASKHQKEKKQGSIMGLKTSSKKKLKKKRKSLQNNVSLMIEQLGKTEKTDTLNNQQEKDQNKINKNKLIKSLLKAERQTLFPSCKLVTKVDNVFLKDNETEKNVSKKKLEDGNQEQCVIKKKVGNEMQEEDKIIKKKVKKIKDGGLANGVKVKKVKKQKLTNGVGREVGLASLEDKESKKDKSKKSEPVTDYVVFSSTTKKKVESVVEQKFKLPKLIYSDSIKVGMEVFSWMLSPVDVKDFFENFWEQKPLCIKRNSKDFFKCVCTLEDFRNALRESDMYFTTNIDVTSYVDGKRTTENPKGKARPSVVWDLYNSGRSIRLLNPQTFIPNVRLLNTTLQEFFGCFVGANIYLTPPGTQGFAPHYDDIEAFVLQLEGEKHWKLYDPRSPDEVLPRESSKNFTEDEIGEPILEVVLKPGDLLYFPRGVIHQAKCLPHVHSLHITVSCYQRNSWADLLEKVLPVALQRAIAEDVELRKGLPIGYLNRLGVAFSDQDSDSRRDFIKSFEELFRRVMAYCPLDAGVDQMGASFMHDAMPPCLTEEEKLYGADRDDTIAEQCLLDVLKNYSDKSLGVKLIRANSVRLVSEQDDIYMYYTTDNSLVYHEQDPSSVTIPVRWAGAIDYLIHSYPKFVEMKDLPMVTKVNKPGKWKHVAEFVYFLWQKGLLLFDRPLQQIYSSSN